MARSPGRSDTNPILTVTDTTVLSARDPASNGDAKLYGEITLAALAAALAPKIAALTAGGTPAPSGGGGQSGTYSTAPAGLNALAIGVYGGSDANPGDFATWIGRRPTNYFVEAHLDKQGRSTWSADGNFGYNIGVAAASTVSPSAVITVQMPLWANIDMVAASSGTYDADFKEWGRQCLLHPAIATQVAAGIKVRVRLPQEFNADYGDLTNWSWQCSNDATKANRLKLTYQRIVTQLRQAAIDAGKTGAFQFTFCPLACAFDWRPAYPGRSYIDFAGTDIYQNLNGGFVGMSGAAEWEAQRTHAFGMQPYKDWAVSENLPLIVDEISIRQDGKADWVKAALTWLATNAVSIGFWNSNGGGYAGKFSDGTYPQSAGEFRHMLNATTYPVDTLDVPQAPNLVAVPGNGIVTLNISESVAGAAGATTGYVLYQGNAAGVDITLTNGKYVVTGLTNGTSYPFRVAGKNIAGPGFKSAAQIAIPTAVAQGNAVTFGSSGQAKATSIPTALTNIGSQVLDLAVDFTPTQSDIDNSAFLVGIWGGTGYVQAFQLNIYSGLHSVSGLWHDNSGNTCYVDSNTQTMVAGTAYTARMIMRPGSANNPTVYFNAKGAAQADIGFQGKGNTNITIGTPTEDPSTHELPALTLAYGTSSNRLQGSISGVRISVGGTEVVNTTATSSGFTDTHGVVWALSGGAVAS